MLGPEPLGEVWGAAPSHRRRRSRWPGVPRLYYCLLGFVAMGVESVVALSGEFVKLRAVSHAGLQPRTTSRQGPRQVA